MGKTILKSFAILFAVVSLYSCNNNADKKGTETQKEVTTETKEVVTDSVSKNLPEVIDFYATWCGPCKLIAPIVEKASETYKGKVKFSKVDVDANGEMAAQYNVTSIPTLVYLDAQGKEVNRTVGYIDEKALDSHINDLLK